MTHRLFTLPKAVVFDANAALVSGAKANFYIAGTLTRQNTFTDAALTIASANPVVADANGVLAPIYLDSSLSYKADVTDSLDVSLSGYPVDNINADDPILGGVLRSIRLRLQPGATPGTNINVSDRSTTAGGMNAPTITDAVNLAKSGTSGSFSLNSSGSKITFDITQTVLGIINSSIIIHDVNSSSTSEVYFFQPILLSGNIDFFFNKRGSSTDVDITTILDAGDLLDIHISFVTNS